MKAGCVSLRAQLRLTILFQCFLTSSARLGLNLCLCHFQLDLSDLQKELAKSESVFPENPSVWVKDLAGYLNYKLQAPRSDPMLSQHPHGQCCFPCPAAAGGLCSPELWGQSSVGSLELRGARWGVMGQPGAGGTMLGKMQPLTYPPPRAIPWNCLGWKRPLGASSPAISRKEPGAVSFARSILSAGWRRAC